MERWQGKMKEVLKIYFTRPTHWFYMTLWAIGISYTLITGAWLEYWYLSLLILGLSPFIEYYTHKYFLHLPMPTDREKHLWFSTFMDHIHYNHHLNPKDVKFIFAQFWLTFPIALLECLLVLVITRSLEITAVFMTCIIFYYLLYEWTHFLAHTHYSPKNAYSRYMKKYHLLHHYKNEHYWYGITTPFADVIFGKSRRPVTVTHSATAKTLSHE